MNCRKYMLGHRLSKGKAKLVMLINNCPALRRYEIEYYVLFTKTCVHYYSGDNIELCMACGKHYGACTWAIINPGDSGITKSMAEQNGEK